MNNEITYVVQNNKTVVYKVILNNRISFVMGISIFGLKKYWHKYFNLIDLNMIPTFEHFLQFETVNSD